jgi:hypothetical protein
VEAQGTIIVMLYGVAGGCRLQKSICSREGGVGHERTLYKWDEAHTNVELSLFVLEKM